MRYVGTQESSININLVGEDGSVISMAINIPVIEVIVSQDGALPESGDGVITPGSDNVVTPGGDDVVVP